MGNIIKIISNENDILKGEVYKDDIRTVEQFMPVGFSHIPQKDAEALLFYIEKGQGYGIAINPKVRTSDVLPEAGETLIYNYIDDAIKSKILLDKNNKITIFANDAEINIEGKNLVIKANDGKIVKTATDNIELTSDKEIKLKSTNDTSINSSANVKIDGIQLQLNGTSKSLVTHAELNTALQLLVTALNTHTHSSVTAGPGTSGTPVTPLTLDISASEAATLKTDG